MKNKRNQILINGIILAIIAVGFCIYFSVNGLWGVAQVFIILIMAGISAMQFFIAIKIFKE